MIAPFPQSSPTSRRLTSVLLRGVLVTVCLFQILTACSHPRVEEFEAGIGRLNQDELVHRFGYPQRLKRLPTGEEVWDYDFLSGRSQCVGYRVYFDRELRAQRWEPRPCR